MSDRRPVPSYVRPFSPYYTPYHFDDVSLFERLNRKQAGFFRRWKNALKRNEGIPIEGQVGYIRKYLSESVRELRPELALGELALTPPALRRT